MRRPFLAACAVCLAFAAVAQAQDAGIDGGSPDVPACSAAEIANARRELFEHLADTVRQAAVQRLAACGGSEAAGALSIAALTDSAGTVRRAATRALATVTTPEARRALTVTLSRDTRPDIRIEAARSLLQQGETEAVRKRVLDTHEIDVLRVEELALLEKNGTPMPAEDLKDLAASETPLLAHAAQAMRERLTPAPPTAPPPPEVVVEAIPPPPPSTPVVEPPVEPEKPPAPVVVLEPPAPPTKAVPVVPPEALVEKPAGPSDGTSLEVTTSVVAGASLMSFLSLLGQQDSTGVLMLTGTAGAIIGGGTAWGLTRFNLRPTLSQAAWYTNVTGWGTFAGLAIYSGSGIQSDKFKWGALVGGESIGIAMGIWSARRWEWTPQQMVLADSLLLGVGLADGGSKVLRGKPFGPTLVSAVGVVPTMLFAAAVARATDPSSDDLHLIGTSVLMSSWTGALLAGGGFNEPFFTGNRTYGGLATGMGAAYVAAVVASAFTEVPAERSWAGVGGMLAGNVLGLGLHMAAAPGDASRWQLGAGLGGLALGVAAFAGEPYLHWGPSTLSMTMMGALYGGGIWSASRSAGRLGDETGTEAARTRGGLLTGSAFGAIAGYMLSQKYVPEFADHAKALTFTGLGLSAGLGIAQLSSSQRGSADSLGVILGSLSGLGFGALMSRADFRGEDIGAGFVGASYGSAIGALVPSLRSATWDDGRPASGGALVGLAAGAIGAGTLAHLTHATGGQVGLGSTAALLGSGIGAGAGLMISDSSQPARIGTVVGSAVLATGALLLDQKLHLSDGLGPSAASLGVIGGLYGATYGLVAAQIAGTRSASASLGGMLMGSTTGLATGLVLSKFYEPEGRAYATSFATSLLGGSLGLGLAQLSPAKDSRADAAGFLLGSMTGLLGGALASRYVHLTDADVGAGFAGLGFGTLVGTLLPSLDLPNYDNDRRGTGGALVGLAAGALGSAAVAHWLHATPGQVAVPTVAGLLGLGVGTGLALLWPYHPTTVSSFGPEDPSQRARVGAVVGTTTLIASSLIADRWLHLSDGLGPRAPSMGVMGFSVGAVYGRWIAGLVDPSGVAEQTPGSHVAGGVLMGATAGLATGVVLSKYFQPTFDDEMLAFGASGAGNLLGLGTVQLAHDTAGRPDTVALLAGSLTGWLAGAYAAHEHVELTPSDKRAALAGSLYGLVLGSLAPSLRSRSWALDRTNSGGAMLGVSLLGVGAVALSHASHATDAQVAVPTVAGLLGAMAGASFGNMFEGSSQPLRVGLFSGTALFAGGSMLLDRSLHLSNGFSEDAPGLAGTGALIGGYLGSLTAPIVAGSGSLDDTTQESFASGAVSGAATGLAAGLLLSKLTNAQGADDTVAMMGTLAGSTLGLGLGMVTSGAPGRGQSVAMLSGALLGLGAAAVTERYAPLTLDDWYAGTVAAGFGGTIAASTSTLGSTEWPGFDRSTTGWTLVGTSAAAFGGAALRHATGASTHTINLGLLGGLDGIMTGLGAGLAFASDGSQNRAARIGITAGALVGMGIGMGAWNRSDWTSADAGLITTAMLVGGWTGAWLPTLQQPSLGAANQTRVMGGALAGVGLASFAASLIGPRVGVSSDLVENAIAMDVLFTGAGLGAGLLASKNDNTPIGSMLAAGTAGLLLGGATHKALDLSDADWPLMSLAITQGLFVGGWLPSALNPPGEVTTRQQIGGLLAGGLGAAGLATLASEKLKLSHTEAWMGATGSAIGASIAGGIGLMSGGLTGAQRVGVMLGGSTLVTVGGTLLASRADFGANAVRDGAVGALLGVSEALTFAWAGRAATNESRIGAGLFGAGMGASLGLAAAAYPHFTAREAPAAAGFAAWGAWMGSFSGAFRNPDAHDVTLGGLVGANVGFLTGYGLLRSGWIQPTDFGWLSLFGAMGTVLGGGIGAPFSSRQDARPVLAGLAVGPAVGMIVGAVLLPKLKAAMGDTGDASAPVQ